MRNNRKYTNAQKNLIERIKKEQHRCCYCGKKLVLEDRTIDHIVPLNRGGQTIEKNLAVACVECNIEKSDMTLEEYGTYLARKRELLDNIDDKIAVAEERYNHIKKSYNEVSKVKIIVDKLQDICNKYYQKEKYLKKLFEFTSDELKCLTNEKRFRMTIFKDEVSSGLIGKLNNYKNREELKSRLNSLDNLFEIDEIIEGINECTIKNSVINKSIINNSIINNSIINNSVINKNAM